MKFNACLEEMRLYENVVPCGTEHLMLALGGYWCFLERCVVDKPDTYKSHNHCLGKDTFN